MSTLVTYSTSHGSTREIAERITANLEASNIPVDLLPIESVETSKLPLYTSFIIGSPLHMGKWLSPARHFISNNSSILNSTPTWAFTVGLPTDEKKFTQEEQAAEKSIKKELPDLKGHKLFQGKAEKTDFGWIMSFLFKNVVRVDEAKWGDHRNWDEISAWAGEVKNAILASQH